MWKFVIFIISCLNKQKSEIGGKLIVQAMVQICAKLLISRLKIVAMATTILILFLDVVFELIEERIWFIYFSGSLVDSFCSLCLFFREIKRKPL